LVDVLHTVTPRFGPQLLGPAGLERRLHADPQHPIRAQALTSARQIVALAQMHTVGAALQGHPHNIIHHE
jgi:hypothetical protein